MDSQKIKISAIVPTYNGGKLIGDTLRSLKCQDMPADEYEIIVVLDGSIDNTLDIVDSINSEGGKEIRSVSLPENMGLHYARHTGAKESYGDILAYTDDDAVCDRGWLSVLLNEYTSDNIAAVGGKILPKWESQPPDWLSLFEPWTLSILDYGDVTKEVTWPENIFGCNFSIRKDVLYSSGGFNPECMKDKWVADGEAGLLRRIYDKGYKVMYTPDAVVWHVIPEARASLQGMKKRFSNHAASKSCYHYNIERYSKPTLILRAVFFFLNSNRQLFLGLRDRLLRSKMYYLRQALACYNRSKAVYEFRLVFDKKLIEVVNRKDWINEE